MQKVIFNQFLAFLFFTADTLILFLERKYTVVVILTGYIFEHRTENLKFLNYQPFMVFLNNKFVYVFGEFSFREKNILD